VIGFCEGNFAGTAVSVALLLVLAVLIRGRLLMFAGLIVLAIAVALRRYKRSPVFTKRTQMSAGDHGLAVTRT